MVCFGKVHTQKSTGLILYSQFPSRIACLRCTVVYYMIRIDSNVFAGSINDKIEGFKLGEKPMKAKLIDPSKALLFPYKELLNYCKPSEVAFPGTPN